MDDRPMRAVFVICAVIALLAGSAAAQFEEVRANIERKLVEQDVPSLAVAVAKQSDI